MSDQTNSQETKSEVNNVEETREAQGVESELEQDLRKLQEERDTLFERLARVTADFKNAQKRLEEDKRQAIEFANSSLILALLPILDNFERAIAVDRSKADVDSIIKGMELIYQQWLATFKAQHVEQIAPKPGDKFDPTLHEALMQQPSEQFKDSPEPVVTTLLQKGYRMRERVLRPAQVAVSAINS